MKCDLLTHAQSKIDFAFPLRGIKHEHSKRSDDLTSKTEKAFVQATKLGWQARCTVQKMNKKAMMHTRCTYDGLK